MSGGRLSYISPGIVNAKSSVRQHGEEERLWQRQQPNEPDREERQQEASLLGSLGRRQALAAGATLSFGLAKGATAATTTFCGTAFPPATYGKVVSNACDIAVYTF